MTLIIDAKSTFQQLIILRDAKEGVEEAEAIESLRVELDDLANQINALAQRVTTLRNEGINLSAIQDLDKAKESVSKIIERFLETPKATTLRRGTIWTSFTKRLQVLINNTQTTLRTDWIYYFDHHLFSGLPPEKQAARLKKTPQNVQALRHYQEQHELFIKYRLQSPTNAKEFDELHHLSQQLTEIVFQEDVPEEVGKFLEALPGGAGLNLVTLEVLTWLCDNGSLANYVVRARNN